MQKPHKEKKARSGGKPKYRKSVRFDGKTQEFNTLASHDGPIPKKKKVRNKPKNRKSEQAKADSLEDGSTCGIDQLNIGEAANDSEIES